MREDGPDGLRRPCDAGDGESCFLLASLYYGGGGVAKDAPRAAELFRKSCDAGWSRGCGGLAECYRAGVGATADSDQAAAYFGRACRGGVPASCYALATMYRQGHDEIRAQAALRQACDWSLRGAIANAAYFRAGDSRAVTGDPRFCAESR